MDRKGNKQVSLGEMCSLEWTSQRKKEINKKKWEKRKILRYIDLQRWPRPGKSFGTKNSTIRGTGVLHIKTEGYDWSLKLQVKTIFKNHNSLWQIISLRIVSFSLNFYFLFLSRIGLSSADGNMNLLLLLWGGTIRPKELNDSSVGDTIKKKQYNASHC